MTVSIRTCCVCGRKNGKSELERHVWQAEGIQDDPMQKLPGRGAYCCAQEYCRGQLKMQKKKWKRWFRL